MPPEPETSDSDGGPRPANNTSMRESSFVKIAKALADPTRHKMLREIRAAGTLTCSCICERFPLKQPTISHHVKTLEGAGLISIEKQGQFHRLTVNEDVVREFVAELGEGATVARKGKTRPVRAADAG